MLSSRKRNTTKLKIKIDAQNDAFQSTDGGVSPATLAECIERQVLPALRGNGDFNGIIRDDNGNTVGKWSIK